MQDAEYLCQKWQKKREDYSDYVNKPDPVPAHDTVPEANPIPKLIDPVDISNHNAKEVEIDDSTSALKNISPATVISTGPVDISDHNAKEKSAAEIDDSDFALDNFAPVPVPVVEPSPETSAKPEPK